MGEFEIECKKITGWAHRIDSCSAEMKRQEGRVEDVLRQLHFHEQDYRGVEQALSGIAASLHRQQEQMKQYADVLGHIAGTYESTEAAILAGEMK